MRTCFFVGVNVHIFALVIIYKLIYDKYDT